MDRRGALRRRPSQLDFQRRISARRWQTSRHIHCGATQLVDRSSATGRLNTIELPKFDHLSLFGQEPRFYCTLTGAHYHSELGTGEKQATDCRSLPSEVDAHRSIWRSFFASDRARSESPNHGNPRSAFSYSMPGTSETETKLSLTFLSPNFLMAQLLPLHHRPQGESGEGR